MDDKRAALVQKTIATFNGSIHAGLTTALTAVLDSVLEEAAQVARPPSHMLGSADSYANGYRSACADINAAIRAMIKD